MSIASSAFNALYFLLYRSPERRRWLGARVLALVNLGILAQSLGGPEEMVGAGGDMLLDSAALLISLFILRQLLARRSG